MISQAKEMVREYLPGIEYAEVRINQQKIRQEKSANCPVPHANGYPERVVVTFSKQINLAEHTHRQFARVTMDRQG